MKIGIITFHYVWNYGAVIQCIALKRVLEEQGYSVCVINYIPKYGEPHILPNPIRAGKAIYMELYERSVLYRLYRSFRRGIKTILDIKKVFNFKQRNSIFCKFQNDYMNLTRPYRSLEELENDPPNCDVYICGSDQLWNPNITGGRYDAAYFLKFGKMEVRRIAYAVSALEFEKGNKEELKYLLNYPDVISLRENKYKQYIEKLIEKKVTICADPTLLIDARCYMELEEQNGIVEPYILVFLLWKGNSAELCKRIIKKLRKKEYMKVVDASPEPFMYIENEIIKNLITPAEWLNLIHNASYVITNSFHCLVLSTIYKRECYIIPCLSDKMPRLLEYCDTIGIMNNCIQKIDDIPKALKLSIDYDTVDQRLNILKSEGIQFLRNSIQKLEG